jgi:3-hydroxyisobutyrate dehydrogenase-like beta-hydroxyacid dehydrogenase
VVRFRPESLAMPPQWRISVWCKALQRIRDHAGDAKISHELPDTVAGILDPAVAAGYGDEEIAAMVQVLLEPA